MSLRPESHPGLERTSTDEFRRARAARQAMEGIHIFVDHSNLTLAKVVRECAAGSGGAARIDYGALTRLLCGPNGCGRAVAQCRTRYLIGSVRAGGSGGGAAATHPPRWVHEARAAGFEVDLEWRLPGGGGEQAVDDKMHGRMLQESHDRVRNPLPQRMIIVTGDGNDNDGETNFVRCAELALQAGWSVDVWTWNDSRSGRWVTLAKRAEVAAAIRLRSFDPFFGQIVIPGSAAAVAHKRRTASNKQERKFSVSAAPSPSPSVAAAAAAAATAAAHVARTGRGRAGATHGVPGAGGGRPTGSSSSSHSSAAVGPAAAPRSLGPRTRSQQARAAAAAAIAAAAAAGAAPRCAPPLLPQAAAPQLPPPAAAAAHAQPSNPSRKPRRRDNSQKVAAPPRATRRRQSRRQPPASSCQGEASAGVRVIKTIQKKKAKPRQAGKGRRR
eukprot:COSAG01_NODE_3035_length_6690_cov_15.742073_4_plen_442_part_00